MLLSIQRPEPTQHLHDRDIGPEPSRERIHYSQEGGAPGQADSLPARDGAHKALRSRRAQFSGDEARVVRVTDWDDDRLLKAVPFFHLMFDIGEAAGRRDE